MKTEVRTHSRIVQLVIETVAVYPRHMHPQRTHIFKVYVLGYCQIITVPETVTVILVLLVGKRTAVSRITYRIIGTQHHWRSPRFPPTLLPYTQAKMK